MTMPGDRVLEDLGTPARVSAGVEPLAELEAQPREHPHEPREEPPGATEGVMVVVRPAQPEPVLPGLLHPGGRVARLPVFALGLEDQVTRQVGRARQLDDALEGRFGGVESLGIVVEPPAPAAPEVQRGQGVAGRVRLHPALAGQIARERLEAQVAPALDDGQRRPLAGDPADPVWPHRIAQDFQAQVVGAGERRDRLDLDRHLANGGPRRSSIAARARGLDRDPGKDPAGMGEDRRIHGVADRLALVARASRAVRPVRTAPAMTR